MLYEILKPTVKAALRLYFRHVNRQGLDHIDNGRPTLILANHTASFMDAILVACFVRRRIHFFARGDVFREGWVDKLLRSIGLLPIYRLSEGKDKMRLNDGSNEEALKILAKGGAVLIFCEGSSDIAKRLKPLKKGPFRLAASAAGILREPPVIIPMGINYITPTSPGGDAFLVAGPSIETKNFRSLETETNLAKAATDLMRSTDAALRALAWHTANEEDEPLADELLLALQESNQNLSFHETQHLIHQLNTADDNEKGQMRSSLEAASAPKASISLTRRILLIILAPLAGLGWLFHLLPLRLASWLTNKKVTSPDFHAPVFLTCVIVFTIIWYLLCIAVAELANPSFIWPLIALVLAFCGILYLKSYRQTLLNHKASITTSSDVR
jgi:1-acyl-sn-glycerol-3-phosphate acyltransferase